MSTVVCARERGRVVIAADSGVWGNTDRAMLKTRKAWRVGEFVLGYCGSIAGLEIARALASESGVPSIGAFARALQERMAEQADLSARLGADKGRHTYQLLAATEADFWELDSEGTVSQIARNYNAIGAGAAVALGAMWLEDTACRRAACGIKAAAELTDYAMLPGFWLGTDGTEGVIE